MSNGGPLGWGARSIIAGAIVLSALLHCAPIVALWQATGRRLPAWSSADPYFYLTLSTVQRDTNGAFRSPWYGNQAVIGREESFRMGLPLRLFHLLSEMAGGEARALIAWHFLLNLLIGLAAVWMLRPVTRDPYALTLSLLALVLVEATVLVDLRQIVRGRLVWIYGLPYFRAFWPQVSIPMVLGALGGMLRWIATRRFRWLGFVALVQFAGFITFPLSAPVILGTVIVSAVAALILGSVRKRQLIGAALAVGASVAVDLLWFLSTSSPIHVKGPHSAFAFDPALVHFRRAFVIPLLLGLGMLLMRRLEGKERAVFGGLAITVALAQTSDFFVSPAFLLGGHFGYFLSLAVSTTIVAMILATHAMFPLKTWRTLASAAILLVVFVACLQTRAMAEVWRPYNVANGQLAGILASLHAGEGDIVAMPVHGFRTRRAPEYHEASWVPLVSRATVLYSHSGGFGLPVGSELQTDRLAAYLFLAGEDSKSLESIFSGPADTPEQHFLAGWEREALIHEISTRTATLAELRRELLPRIEQLLHDPTSLPLGGARRLIVADYRVDPVFDATRIESLTDFESVIDFGAWRVRVGHPKH